jgi:hypothetical protein
MMENNQGGLTDEEFACLLMRSCGVANLVGALGSTHDVTACGFCNGSKHVDTGRGRHVA